MVPSTELFPSEHQMIRRSSQKRIAEFVAGRFYARRALGALDLQPKPIISDSNRAPIWPAGVVGSISHCDKFCGAMVARVADASALGFDIEDSAALDTNLASLICPMDELEKAFRASSRARGDVAKILFSIKESIYKAYFPATRHFLDFKDVFVSIDWQSKLFEADIIGQQSPALFGMRSVTGSFDSQLDVVFAFTLVKSRSD